MSFELTSHEKVELLKIARHSLEACVKGKKYEHQKPISLTLCEKAGAFVTLKKRDDLRGCIGMIEGRLPLYETVREMAIEAALNDPRFDAVTENELTEIEIEISVLSPPQIITKIEQIVVGRDGLIVESGYNRGLLLPQVAVEYNWDHNTFLRHTCLKAGLPQDSFKDSETKIFTFTATVFSESKHR